MKIYKRIITTVVILCISICYMYAFISNSLYSLGCGILLYALIMPSIGLLTDQEDDVAEFSRFKRRVFYKCSKNYRWIITTVCLIIIIILLFDFMNNLKSYIFVTSYVSVIDGHIINITVIIIKLFIVFYYLLSYIVGIICTLCSSGRKRDDYVSEFDRRGEQAS